MLTKAEENSIYLTDVIYDTLMQNTQNPQFNIEEITEQEVNCNRGTISFIFEDVTYELRLTATHKATP